MSAYLLRPLSVGEVLDTSFAIYRRQFNALIMVSIVTQALPAVWTFYSTTRPSVEDGGFSSLLAQIVVSIILGSVGTAASTFIVSEEYLGRPVSFGDAMYSALPYVVRLIVVSLLVALVAGIGVILLIVPGIILFTGLSLATTSLVIENISSPTEAMSRSWRLTDGLKGKIFTVFCVGILLLMVPSIALGAFTAMSVASGSTTGIMGFLLVQVALQILIYPLIYVAFTVLYYDARVRKEGFDLEMLAGALPAV